MNRLIFIPITLLLLCASCKKDSQTGNETPAPTTTTPVVDSGLKDSSQRTYLALGDSYTIGTAVSLEETYPSQVVAMLNKDSANFLQPEIRARNGWTTTNLLSSLEQFPVKRSRYSFVTLLIGVNNQHQGQSMSQYHSEFSLLLSKAIIYADNKKNRVIVLSIPDYSYTPYGMNNTTTSQQIAEFNAINKQITLSYGCNYVDITAISKDAGDDNLIAPDGLHYSGMEYTLWSQLVVPVIKENL